jgi:hypothetical protein
MSNTRKRDTQRSRVYAWERHASGGTLHVPTMQTLEEATEFLAPIWRAERGRYGRAKVPAPVIERPSWGQRRAIAHHDHRITLPRASRNPWTILHEAAHRLTPGDGHGPRFVGVLIGLLARHHGQDAQALMASADAMGVKYHVRSIGAVPVRETGPAEAVMRAVQEQGPMSEMDLACWLDLSYRQVRGAALSLIRAGRARWLRHKLTSLSSVGEGA